MAADTSAPRPRRSGPSPMAGLFVLLIVGLVAWTGWWFWLVNRVEGEIEARAEGLRERGWTVEWHDQRISGWPFRARFEVRHVTIAAPSGHAIATPRMIAEANAYAPTHWVAVAEEGLVLTRGEDKGRVAIGGGAARASVTRLTAPQPTFALQLVEPEFTALPGSQPFPLSGADRVEVHLRQHQVRDDEPSSPGRQIDVFFRLEGARGRPQGPIDRMTADARLDLLVEAVVDDAEALRGADIPTALAAWSAAGGRFQTVKGEVRAGDAEALMTSPVLTLSEDGRLQGVVTLDARRATPMLDSLAGRDASGQVEGAPAAPAPTPDTARPVELELIFRDGRAYLGAFPIAPAPKLF
ncbi:DUF2125 domain-containing protein [Brevundimonas sp.]|uniref:DUF2125 domain-containing protein n=1 Tax=Brevundimonas sp. TaxID=1871086 RepID=UPI0035B094BF